VSTSTCLPDHGHVVAAADGMRSPRLHPGELQRRRHDAPARLVSVARKPEDRSDCVRGRWALDATERCSQPRASNVIAGVDSSSRPGLSSPGARHGEENGRA
jgi:hypothetical protein